MTPPQKSKTGLRRVWNAFFYSMDGFRAALPKPYSHRVLALVLEEALG